MSGNSTMTMSGTEFENIFILLFYLIIFIYRGYIAPEILDGEKFISFLFKNILFYFILY
jgi:hypothetical protein